MDEGRLGQVLVNLLVNAAQAIPKPSSKHEARDQHGDGRDAERRGDGRDRRERHRRRHRPGEPAAHLGALLHDEGPGGRHGPRAVDQPRDHRARGRAASRRRARSLGASRRARALHHLAARRRGGRAEATPRVSPVPRLVLEAGARPRGGGRGVARPRAVRSARAACTRWRWRRAPTPRWGCWRAGSASTWCSAICACPDMSRRRLLHRGSARAILCLRGAFIFMTGVGFGADVERFLASVGPPAPGEAVLRRGRALRDRRGRLRELRAPRGGARQQQVSRR